MNTLRHHGFTLLELIVALAIFSVVSMLAFGGLLTIQDSREHITQASTKLAKLQMAFTILERDITQIVPRGIRGEFGDPKSALIGGGQGVSQGIEFTRTGLRNPTGRPRSHMQRVGYTVKENNLTRLSWQVLDRAQDAEVAEMILLENVESLSFRYLDTANRWTNEWPPNLVELSEVSLQIPKAIEVTLDVEGWGTLLRLFRTSGERPPVTATEGEGTPP